jgi:hypothetical protein
MLLPLQGNVVNGQLHVEVHETLGIEIYVVQPHQSQFLTLLRLLAIDESQEIVLVIVDEVEDEAGSVLELNEETLLLGEVASLYDVSYFYEGPILFNGPMLRQHKKGEFEVRIFLEG